MKRIRVLQVVPSLSLANGVAACICNYFTNIDKNAFEFTFVSLRAGGRERYEAIEREGGRIVELHREGNIFAYIKRVEAFFRENKFDIIHCNVANTGLVFLYYAKKYSVGVRIIHSHATSSSDKLLNKIRNDIILIFTKRLANVYFACSEAAGRAMFGGKDYFVLNNCIDGQKFKYNEVARAELRKRLGLCEEDFVIGNIGRLCKQKNQKFLLDLVERLPGARLIIVGNGYLEEALKKYVEQKGLEKQVIFTGSIDNTHEMYSVFDVFVLPSLYEGLPVVGVEAQANGLPCLFSDRITREVRINENVEFVGLKVEDWVERLGGLGVHGEHEGLDGLGVHDGTDGMEKTGNWLGRLEEAKNKFSSSNYNLEREVRRLEDKYKELL